MDRKANLKDGQLRSSGNNVGYISIDLAMAYVYEKPYLIFLNGVYSVRRD